jgi:succinate dehydrogenase / fumarate reductase iron-sulfur subunit
VKITLRIQRFNPKVDQAPYLQDYDVEVQPTDRVLDALIRVKELDGTLGFRKSCAHGVCGSDGMVINGQERLACKTLVQDVAEGDGVIVTVEPLRHLSVLRDLIVQQDAFFERWRKVKPFLINTEPAQSGERIQSQKERAAFDDPTKCILCASSYSACPILDEENPRFIGPAAIAQAARFALDSRDQGFEERIEVLDHPDGVWACQNHFQCTLVCPRGIKVTKQINLTKRLINQGKPNSKRT